MTSPTPATTRRTAFVAALVGGLAVAAVGGGIFIANTSMAAATPAASGSSSVVVPHTTPVPHPTPVQPVRTPSDPALAGAQKDLTQLGYYHGPINGELTPSTVSALTSFQSWAKGQSFGGSVTVNGHFDPPTQYALNCALGGNAYGPGATS